MIYSTSVIDDFHKLPDSQARSFHLLESPGEIRLNSCVPGGAQAAFWSVDGDCFLELYDGITAQALAQHWLNTGSTLA